LYLEEESYWDLEVPLLLLSFAQWWAAIIENLSVKAMR
jgi:hypothetical protein